ncbi:MAG: hypothetical protein R3C68_04250 [Myxococcota bacterium]
MGFTRIETILEESDPVEVGENLNLLLKSLEKYQDEAGTNKDKAAARKAIGAVERTIDLMDYLFQTKAAMQAAPK